MARPGPLRGALALLLILLLAAWGARPARPGGRLASYPWLYLRGGLPLEAGGAASSGLVEVIALGDTNLGRAVDAPSALRDAGPWLREADLVFANLECAIAPQGLADAQENEGATGPFRLVAPPAAAAALRAAGIDLLGLANNHSLDAGPEGLAETTRRLRAEGLSPAGAGPDAEAAYAPVVREVRGVRLAFLAFNAIPPAGGTPAGAAAGWTVAAWDEERALRTVRAARSQADAVIVGLHWGYEYQREADPGQERIARALLAAGADLVAGHHPHVIQGAGYDERAGGAAGFVFYSLGNFAFDQAQPGSETGLALRAFFDRRGLRALQGFPVAAGPRPRLAGPQTPLPAPAPLGLRRETLAFTCRSGGCTGSTAAAVSNRAGIPSSVALDLTGDRRPEEVRLAEERMTILEGGRPTWHSPPEWRVLDMAPGDPDGDGRGDLVLAVLKPGEDGRPRSHPYVLGYRGGLYRLVWGGSAVRDRIVEVETGDVDGDGAQDLLVLEEERDGLGRAVTLWRWHGWGFSLDWRSGYGDYENLRFVGKTIFIDRLGEKIPASR